MGLTKITETPAEQGQDGNNPQGLTTTIGKGVGQLKIKNLYRTVQCFHAAQGSNRHERNITQRQCHQQSLDQVGPADGQETAEAGI